MEALKLFTGTPKKNFIQPKYITPLYPNPLIPRMVLEVNKSDNVCIACNSPDLIENNALSVSKLVNYVKQKMVSETFMGFVMTCLLESEDLVDSLNLNPHVFKQRVFMFRPPNACILELCILISMIENCSSFALGAILSILKRARNTYARNPSLDSSFLLHGIETLCSTAMTYFKLDPQQTHTIYPGLLMYKLHSVLGEGSIESQGLLKPIYLDSFKMAPDPMSSFEEDDTTTNVFNIFYSTTIFTSHLQCEKVIQTYKDTCLFGLSRPQILS